jgi:hypothetical protein
VVPIVDHMNMNKDEDEDGHSLKYFIEFVVPSLTSLQKSHMHTPRPVQGVFSN